jgi:hypothetical protein
MKILKFDMYLDGGTIKLVTDEEVFCFDNRIKTKTKGDLYKGYPKADNSNLVDDIELRQELIKLAEEFGDKYLYQAIQSFKII